MTSECKHCFCCSTGPRRAQQWGGGHQEDVVQRQADKRGNKHKLFTFKFLRCEFSKPTLSENHLHFLASTLKCSKSQLNYFSEFLGRLVKNLLPIESEIPAEWIFSFQLNLYWQTNCTLNNKNNSLGNLVTFSP